MDSEFSVNRHVLRLKSRNVDSFSRLSTHNRFLRGLWQKPRLSGVDIS